MAVRVLDPKEYKSLLVHLRKATEAWLLDRGIDTFMVEVDEVDDNEYVVELVVTEGRRGRIKCINQ